MFPSLAGCQKWTHPMQALSSCSSSLASKSACPRVQPTCDKLMYSTWLMCIEPSAWSMFRNLYEILKASPLPVADPAASQQWCWTTAQVRNGSQCSTTPPENLPEQQSQCQWIYIKEQTWKQATYTVSLSPQPSSLGSCFSLGREELQMAKRDSSYLNSWKYNSACSQLHSLRLRESKMVADGPPVKAHAGGKVPGQEEPVNFHAKRGQE